MHKKKDNGVSPVIATILLISLSVVLVAIVSVSVMSGLSSFSAVDTKIVGFTVVVNDNETATVTPVSGPDLPYLQSYTVYLDNGHIQSVPESGSDVLSGAIITDFDDNVTRINIAGNFTDGITALVFSGKVINKTVVYDPSHGGEYYVVGSEPYANASAFVDSLNAWKNGTAALSDNTLLFYNDIIVADQPIVLTDAIMDSVSGTLLLNTGWSQEYGACTKTNITITRAPGYDGELLVIDSGTLHSLSVEIVLDGTNQVGSAPLLVIDEGATLDVDALEGLHVINGINVGGNGGGIYNAGTLAVSNYVVVTGNKAEHGAGIYNLGTIDFSTDSRITISDNEATGNGGGVYNAASNLITIKGTISNNKAGGNGGGVYNAGPLILTYKIQENEAAGNGGGIYNGASGTLTLSSGDASVYNNTANGDGGGIYNQGSITALTSASYNTALGNGGGIYNRGTYLATSGSISNNQAQNGGGIYNDISGKLGDATQSSAFASTISHNKATVNGGGVYNAGYVYFGWPAISDNTASNAGQQYYATLTSTNTASESYFSYGRLKESGSGYYYID